MANEYRKWKILNQYSEKNGKAGKESMKLREKIMTADPDGGLYIPPEVLQKMGIEPETQIYVSYLSENEDLEENTYHEFLLTKNGSGSLDELEIDDEAIVFKLPDELLKEAGIDPNADLDIVLQKQKITILSAMKPEEVVPPEILEACAELGISPEKVSTILRTEGDLSGLETDI